MKKRKHKVGTIVEFSFAGETLMGEIKAIEIDNAYSVTTEWYKIKHTDGTIYPLRTNDKSINKLINK
jgi:hypothetical protein